MFDWKMIDEKKTQLDKLRPFPKSTLKSLQEKISLEWTYHSNAIEGNTLTLKETKVALEGITIGGKSVREHLEAINHKDAIQYLYEIIKNKEKLSEWQIKQIHALILKKIDPKNAGAYRKENVLISGAKHIPPDHIHVSDEMKNLLSCYKTKWKDLHPLERASLLHIDFVKIHPFTDGNGRTSRLLQNFELIKEGFPPIVIKKEKRLEYYDALDKAHTEGDCTDFMKLSAECLEKSLDLYLQTVCSIHSENSKKLDSRFHGNDGANRNDEFRGNDEVNRNDKTQRSDKVRGNDESIKRPSFREDESSQIPALQLLQNMGWTYLEPEEALNFRKNNAGNVLLEDILESQLRNINQIKHKGSLYQFRDVNISNAVHELKTMPFGRVD